MRPASGFHQAEAEEEALLPDQDSRRPPQEVNSSLLPKSLGGWKAHPFWLLPVVLIASMSRGITMAPRIQVFKTIACRALNPDGDSSGFANGTLTALAIDCSGSAVQGRAAKIQASVVTIMSILSAITTGFWSRFGDVYGRKPILSMFLVGAISMEFSFVLVMDQNSIFGRYAEQFILAGPILEGFVGGLSAFNGVVHAYTSDCTRHGSRSKIFSTIQGTVFVGLAMGPWLSGILLPQSEGTNVYFYTSISLLAFTLLYIVVICPESLRPSVQHRNPSRPEDARQKVSTLLALKRYTRKFLAALAIPIVMFAPRPLRSHELRKSYNLTLLGLGLFMYLISTGIYQSKYMYAQHVYSWTTPQLGHYMSILWIGRALNLLVFLPIVISYLKPKRPQSVDENSALPPENIAAELRFDKYLAQCSLAVDGLADFFVAITPTSSQSTFIALSCLSSMTSGGNPALHSLGAVCLHACGYGSEVGALFGAIAVVSAIAHIISPSIYALTYSSTVAYFPQAIFCLAAGLLTSGVLLLSGIKARVGDIVPREGLWLDEEEEDGEALHRRPRIGSESVRIP